MTASSSTPPSVAPEVPAASPAAALPSASTAVPPTAEWLHQRESGNLLMLRLMRWIALVLGRRVARLTLHPITLFFMLVQRRGAQASGRYLQQLWGRPSRWSERYAHLFHFAATVLDRVYLLRGGGKGFDWRASGVAHYDAAADDGKGVIFLGAHVGSFEVLRALGEERRGLRVAMVMYEENARKINAALRAVAPGVDLTVIGLGKLDSMLTLRDWLDGGGVAGLLGDRTMAATVEGARVNQVVLPFLGRPAVFSDGPFRLAALLRRPVVFMAGLYLGGKRYDLRFLPVADFRQRERGPGATAAMDRAVREAMERYVAILEAICRETPYNWFNFYDYWATAEGLPITKAAAAPPPSVGPSASRNPTGTHG